MAFSLKTHEFAMKRGQPVQIGSSPYMRLCEGQGPAIFIQAGALYYENGVQVKEADYPDWLEGQLKALNPEAAAEVGLTPDKPEKNLKQPPKGDEPTAAANTARAAQKLADDKPPEPAKTEAVNPDNASLDRAAARPDDYKPFSTAKEAAKPEGKAKPAWPADDFPAPTKPKGGSSA